MKKKNFLYIAPVMIDYEALDGVAKKVLNQFEVFSERFHGHLIHYGKEGIIYTDGNNRQVFTYDNKHHRKHVLYRNVKTIIEKNEISYCYIRYPRSDYYFVDLLKTIKKRNIKTVVEIPTYPYDLGPFRKLTIKGKLIRILDCVYRKKLHKYVDRIVTYSDDDRIWEIETIRTINGISYQKNHIRVPLMHPDKIILISCAWYYDCHGCDRLIAGLAQYYKNGGDRNIIFHIVGDGEVIPDYKQQVKNEHLESHVIFDGFCTGDQLNELYDIADIGVNSLAIHRLGLKKESTLKVKEYAAKGLPIISSYPVDVFAEKESDTFVLLVPGDDSVIDVKQIVAFYDSIYACNTAEQVAATIRNLSKEICDMPNTLRRVIEFYES